MLCYSNPSGQGGFCLSEYKKACQKQIILEMLKDPETRRFARDVMVAYPEVA